jgi:hypothetical protein
VSHPRIVLHTHCCYKLKNLSRSLQNLIQKIFTIDNKLSFVVYVVPSTCSDLYEAIRQGGYIHRITDTANYVEHSHVLQQNSLYLYSFVYNLPDNGLVQAETYRRDIVNNKLLFIVDCPNCWIKYHTFILLHGIWSTLNSHQDNCSETQAYVVAVFNKTEYGKIFVYF